MCVVPGGKNERMERNGGERRNWHFASSDFSDVIAPPLPHPSHWDVSKGECSDCGAKGRDLAAHCRSVQVPG